MSSYSSSAQLEAQRKAKVMQELNDTIQKMKAQLSAKCDNGVSVAKGLNTIVSIVEDDEASGGLSEEDLAVGSAFLGYEIENKEEREVLDFSGLLSEVHDKPTPLQLELDSWIKMVDDRPVISEADESDRIRVIAELKKLMEDASVDIEDKIVRVRMRVNAYLQGGSILTESDKKLIESEYMEYCAMCALLQMKPVEHLPSRVKKELIRMRGVLEKRAQDDYIMGVIEDIMNELGCHVKDEAVLDKIVGQTFTVDGNPLCEIFVGEENGGIMFEPVGENRASSSEEKHRVEESANSVCSMYKELEERAAERGVILSRIYMRPVNAEEIVVRNEVAEKHTGGRRKRAEAKKQRSMGLEG